MQNLQQRLPLSLSANGFVPFLFWFYFSKGMRDTNEQAMHSLHSLRLLLLLLPWRQWSKSRISDPQHQQARIQMQPKSIQILEIKIKILRSFQLNKIIIKKKSPGVFAPFILSAVAKSPRFILFSHQSNSIQAESNSCRQYPQKYINKTIKEELAVGIHECINSIHLLECWS